MFKVGDKVRCIVPLGYLEKNKIYEVVERMSDTLINVKDIKTGKVYEGYYDHRFKSEKISNSYNYI